MERALHAFVPDSHLYPAVLELFKGMPTGRILDVPSGTGAFAQELLRLGHRDIHCLDINGAEFGLKHPDVNFQVHDVAQSLPYPNASFDYVFSLEGLEHFEGPWVFVKEACRVLRPGGRLFISTPNTFSVDARLKYLLSGYFPRFRPLMQDPARVMGQGPDQAHISPIYYWQLHYFLQQSGVHVGRISTNTLVYKPGRLGRAVERWFAAVIRKNLSTRKFPDGGVSSEAMLFGDCIILEGIKAL